jgi:hypothetical protein
MTQFSMTQVRTAGLLFAAAMALGGCLTPNPGIGPNGELPVIARPSDSGYDRIPLSQSQMPAVAYDPDGCQVWILDDGVEGYSGRRRDPRSGLPVCNNQYPPGSVVRDYRTNGVPDFIPTPVYGPPQGVLR